MIFPNIRNKSGGAEWLIDGAVHFVRSRVVVDQKGAFVGIVSGSGFFITSESPFSPASLFAAGEQGVWYDPSDFSTLFQDAAGTVPVTAVEQPVGKILDKSGRGNHASQATTTARGILRKDANGAYYIAIDGTDDNYVTSSINFTATDKMTIWAGLRKVGDTESMLCELSTAWAVPANTGAFSLQSGPSTVSYFSGSRATTAAAVNQGGRFNSGLYPAPDSAVITATHDISGDLSSIRRNGSSAGAIDGTGDKGAGNFGNYPLYLFSRAGTSFRWKGNFYGLIIRGAATDTAPLEQTEQWLNTRMGGIY